MGTILIIPRNHEKALRWYVTTAAGFLLEKISRGGGGGAEDRVSSDLENVENLGMSGNFDSRRKSPGKFRDFCCVKSIFSQSKHPDFENFPGEHASKPPNVVLDTHENLIVVWKSQGKVRDCYPVWRLDALKRR